MHNKIITFGILLSALISQACWANPVVHPTRMPSVTHTKMSVITPSQSISTNPRISPDSASHFSKMQITLANASVELAIAQKRLAILQTQQKRRALTQSNLPGNPAHLSLLQVMGQSGHLIARLNVDGVTGEYQQGDAMPIKTIAVFT